MFCKYCGNQLVDGTRFCPKCGKPVDPISTEQSWEDTEGMQEREEEFSQYTYENPYYSEPVQKKRGKGVLIVILIVAIGIIGVLLGRRMSGTKIAKNDKSTPFAISDTTSGKDGSSDKEETVDSDGITVPKVQIKSSPDKYTQYIKSYVGMNALSVGYTSLGEDRMDRLGPAVLQIIFVSKDGTFVDYFDESILDDYVVTGQSLAPNTEVKLTFQKDSDGQEYDNLVDTQSYESIILSVEKRGEGTGWVPDFSEITASPDKNTCYIRDYTGLNLASFGYTSLGGDRRDTYGKGNIELKLVTDDGSVIPLGDDNEAETNSEEDSEDNTDDPLRNYVVTGQDIAPNTQLTYTFNSEYDFVESQSLDAVTLYVKKIGG